MLAQIRYLSVPGAIIAGFIIWNEIPTYLEVIGSFITISSCIVIAWRELIKKNWINSYKICFNEFINDETFNASQLKVHKKYYSRDL